MTLTGHSALPAFLFPLLVLPLTAQSQIKGEILLGELGWPFAAAVALGFAAFVHLLLLRVDLAARHTAAELAARERDFAR